MSAALRVLSGARAGHRERFHKSVVLIGRHPLCDLRFDATLDLDVSARHAEIRAVAGRHLLLDVGSTNGTFVNGRRLDGDVELHVGDVVALGTEGPTVLVEALDAVDAPPEPRDAAPASAARAPTSERIASAVRTQTIGLRRLVALLVAALLVVLGGAWWIGRRDTDARARQLDDLVRRNEALQTAYRSDVARLAGTVTLLDSALAAARRRGDALRATLERRRASATRAEMRALGDTLRLAERGREALLALSRRDYTAVAQANGRAVALLVVEHADGSRVSGTAFAITDSGTLVTNRHLVLDAAGRPPRRIAVIFSGSSDWLPARVLRADDGSDLALLAMERSGTFPVVAGVARSAESLQVGAPVAVIGYPLGASAPMPGDELGITASPTLGAGTVSKLLGDIVQIDAFATHGSSGSPVFDTHGVVVGVVYGGVAESGGRMVLAVPAHRISALVATVAPELLR